MLLPNLNPHLSHTQSHTNTLRLPLSHSGESCKDVHTLHECILLEEVGVKKRA